MLDLVVDPLQKIIDYKPKEDAVQQEFDDNEEMIQSALRAIASLYTVRFKSELLAYSEHCTLLYIPVY